MARAEYYAKDGWGWQKCKPGNKVRPAACDYHPTHHWCKTCEGFYGVPHDMMHEGPSAHPQTNPSTCACRLCRDEVERRAKARAS